MRHPLRAIDTIPSVNAQLSHPRMKGAVLLLFFLLAISVGGGEGKAVDGGGSLGGGGSDDGDDGVNQIIRKVANKK